MRRASKSNSKTETYYGQDKDTHTHTCIHQTTIVKAAAAATLATNATIGMNAQ